MRHSIDLICPTRTSTQQKFFLDRMINSVKENSAFDAVDMRFLICLDQDGSISLDYEDINLTIINSDGHSQSKALNAGLKMVKSDFVAIIEDDDQWNTNFLKLVLRAFETQHIDFISSNQLEIDMTGKIIRINDFPTPSGWIFKREILEKVGFFSENFKWHLDNDFLGRINKLGISRGHFIEKFAPIDVNLARQVRPWIANIFDSCKGKIKFLRHHYSSPLIIRQVHPESGTFRIDRNKKLKTESQTETKKLTELYGNVPW